MTPLLIAIYITAACYVTMTALFMLWLLRGRPAWGAIAMLTFVLVKDAMFFGAGQPVTLYGALTFVSMIVMLAVSLAGVRNLERRG